MVMGRGAPARRVALLGGDRFGGRRAGRSRKARNLRAEPRCVVHSEGPDVVVVNGVAEQGALAPIIEAYRAKYPELPPDPAENPIIRVRPVTVIGIDEREFTTSPTRWRFSNPGH